MDLIKFFIIFLAEILIGKNDKQTQKTPTQKPSGFLKAVVITILTLHLFITYVAIRRNITIYREYLALYSKYVALKENRSPLPTQALPVVRCENIVNECNVKEKKKITPLNKRNSPQPPIAPSAPNPPISRPPTPEEVIRRLNTESKP